VHVDAAARKRLEHSFRQDLAVGHHHRELGAGGAQPLGHLRRPRRSRLIDRDAGGVGSQRDRRPCDLLAATRRLVRLGNRQHHLVVGDACRERRQRKFRRAHEDDAHGLT
jgi:hypothetical protein